MHQSRFLSAKYDLLTEAFSIISFFSNLETSNSLKSSKKLKNLKNSHRNAKSLTKFRNFVS